MDEYFNAYREMFSLHGLTGHTIKSYSTYIRSYLGYLSDIFTRIPLMSPGRNFVDISNGVKVPGP